MKNGLVCQAKKTAKKTNKLMEVLSSSIGISGAGQTKTFIELATAEKALNLNSNFQIPCDDVLFSQGFGDRKQSKLFIFSVYYHPKYFMKTQKRKTNIEVLPTTFDTLLERSNSLLHTISVHTSIR